MSIFGAGIIPGMTSSSGVPSGRRRHLTGVARQVVTASGWDGLGMQRLADAAGVSRQTVYNEFGGKRSLIAAIAESIAEDFLDEVEEAIRTSDSFAEAWERAVRATVAAMSRSPVPAAPCRAGSSGRASASDVALVVRGTERLSWLLVSWWPELERARVDTSVETTLRLIASYAAFPRPDQVDAASDALLLPWLRPSTKDSHSVQR